MSDSFLDNSYTALPPSHQADNLSLSFTIADFLHMGRLLDMRTPASEAYDSDAWEYLALEDMICELKSKGVLADEWVRGFVPGEFCDARFLGGLREWALRVGDGDSGDGEDGDEGDEDEDGSSWDRGREGSWGDMDSIYNDSDDGYGNSIDDYDDDDNDVSVHVGVDDRYRNDYTFYSGDDVHDKEESAMLLQILHDLTGNKSLPQQHITFIAEAFVRVCKTLEDMPKMALIRDGEIHEENTDWFTFLYMLDVLVRQDVCVSETVASLVTGEMRDWPIFKFLLTHTDTKTVLADAVKLAWPIGTINPPPPPQLLLSPNMYFLNATLCMHAELMTRTSTGRLWVVLDFVHVLRDENIDIAEFISDTLQHAVSIGCINSRVASRYLYTILSRSGGISKRELKNGVLEYYATGALYEQLREYSDADVMSLKEAVTFVNGLEKVDVESIATEDMRCGICWNDYGQLDKEDADNDPVRTECGHLYGRDCLVQALQNNSQCPLCRRELRRDGVGRVGMW